MAKILYAVQGTGNGHIARAMEVLPYLSKVSDVDVLVSGTQSDISLPCQLTYQLHGLSFTFGNSGSVDFSRTIRAFKPIRFIKDLLNLKVEDYDLVINDFEPVSAWACKLKNLPCIALSHQASFQSHKTPRPEKICRWSEFVLKNYAPTTAEIGIHFESYDDNI